MKKIILITLTAFVMTQNVMAEFVKPDIAAQYAKCVLEMKQTPQVEKIPNMRAPGIGTQNDMPAYYVFNNPQGGWAIIAADDRVNPIIAYSNEGSFNLSYMPDNLKWWMDGISEVVDAARDQDWDAPEYVRAAWEALQAGRNITVEGTTKYMETAKWNQGEPFNNQCPVALGDNSRAVTGCVATAMSIIMNYNQWPVHGKGVIGGYTTSTYPTYIPAYDLENHYYDWDLMSQEVVMSGNTRNWSFEQKEAVSQLIHDCGVAVHMDYTSEGSGAGATGAINAFKENMSYNRNAELITKSSYTNDEWFAKLKNEIDNGRVAYYSGHGSGGGHAFVCDGYDTEGSKVRINWGWSGYGNGFFTIDLTDKANDVEFCDMQQAIIGLAPDTTVVDVTGKDVDVVLDYYREGYGLETRMWSDITEGGEFSFEIGWISCVSPGKVKCEFKICLEDKDGNVRQEGWFLNDEFDGNSAYLYARETEKTTLTVSPNITDHFRLYIKNRSGEWVPMPGNYDVLPGVDGVFCGVTPNPVIIVPDGCTAGETVKLSLTYGGSPVTETKWSLNGTEVEGDQVTLVQGKNTIRADVKCLDGSDIRIVRTLEF